MATFRNNCRFNATSIGVGAFVVASAVAPYKTPEQALAVDGKVYYYFAQSDDGLQYEQGSGTYTYATDTLARTTITQNSAGTLVPLAFTVVPKVDVFPSPLVNLEFEPVGKTVFPSGTLMLFQQTAAPTYWTKQTTHNDKALRVVSGTASSGGTNAFSTVMAQTTVGNKTLGTNEIPSHAHSEVSGVFTLGYNFTSPGSGGDVGDSARTTGYQGGGGSHNHTIAMSIQYVDLIIASKD